MPSYRKRGCKCPKNRKCTCGATWSYIVDLPRDPVTNKRRQKEVGGFKTKADAVKAATAAEDQLNKGIYVEESAKAFGEFAGEWLAMYQATGKVKVSTVRVRQHEINRLLDYFNAVKLKDIDLDLYQKALHDLKDKGYSKNTISGVHQTAGMIFKEALKRNLIRKNPVEFAYIPTDQATVEQLEQTEEIPKYLEKQELKKLLDTAHSDGLESDYILFLTLAYTGIRVGELCALKWSDLNAEEETISITKTYYNPTNVTDKYQLLTPKTKTSRRVIDIDPSLVQALQQHKAEQNEMKMKFRKHYHDEDFIFARSGLYAGYPHFIKTIENRMKRLLQLSGLDTRLTPHSLRHTHTSLLAEADVSLEAIMERLGHKDDKTTRNVYLHITKERKKEAVQKFGQLMKNV